MNAEVSDLLALAEDAASAAGELLVRRRRGLVEVAATKSSRTDVVTEADVASERLIRERLLGARPEDGFVGEEGNETISTSGVEWVVDPIDGTVNFLYGIPQFAVSIAARVDGVTTVGVVHNPVTGDTFTAGRGLGARLGQHRIQVSDCTDPAVALVGTGFSYEAHVREHQAAEVGRLLPAVRDVRRMGSAALDLCAVARGQLDAYAERGLHPWDLAAGELIVQEAGGRVEGIRGTRAGGQLVIASSAGLFVALHEVLLQSGFGDWPLPDWPMWA
ncbi:MAG: inositol monophosphatase family protein [Nocardioidaceae bacterium]